MSLPAVPSDRPDQLIAVGRIGPVRGVRGDVFVEPWTDAPDERFAPGATLTARARDTDGAAPEQLEVEASSSAGGKLVVHFHGVDDRPAAEALRGIELFVAAARRPALSDPDEFYDSDLVGLTVSTVHGDALGPVLDVVHAGGASYLNVRIGNRDHLIPFVSAIVPTVDPQAGTIVVDPPDGLFDL